VKRIAAWLRDRLEGLIVLALLPPWLAVAALVVAAGVLRGGAPAATLARAGSGLRRLLCFVAQGLRPLRESWWVVFKLESAWSIWRCLLMLEWFGLRNIASPPRTGAPADRVLVVKLSHVGDLLHTVPLLRALREARPSARIHLMVGPWCESVARRIPYVDGLVVYAPRFEQFDRGQRTRSLPLARETVFLGKLRREAYDWVITPEPTHPAVLLVAHALRPALWVGVAPETGLYPAPFEKRFSPPNRAQYQAEWMLGLLRSIGIEHRDTRLEFWLQPEERAFAETTRAALPGDRDRPVVLLAPGAGWVGKQWNDARHAAVADELARRHGARVVIVGSPPERDLALRIERGAASALTNLAGGTTLGQLAALIAGADLLIGSDSAAIHFAAAFDTPSVALFGPTTPDIWAPRGTGHVTICRNDSCRDCWSWHPRATCAKNGWCMNLISVEEVVGAADTLLRQRRTGAGKAVRV
jgi:ADP-heptose:LPS heptosyltransferase